MSSKSKIWKKKTKKKTNTEKHNPNQIKIPENGRKFYFALDFLNV